MATYWQVLKTTKTFFLFYRAYYDDRVKSLSFVRILLLADSQNITERIYCQLWFDEQDDPVISKVIQVNAFQPIENGYSSHLMSCKNPVSKIPKFVSIVKNECDKANNILKINYKPKEKLKKDFIVCSNFINSKNDTSNFTIEWLETLKMVGAEKVVIYVISGHPETIKTLKFYELEKFLDFVTIEFPQIFNGQFIQNQLMQNYLILLHDCYYRNYNEFNFIVPLNFDEFIVPVNKKDQNWKEMLDRINNDTLKNFDSYKVKNILKIFTANMKSESEIISTSIIYDDDDSDFESKSFISTSNALTLTEKNPSKCLNDLKNCTTYKVDIEDATLTHYRYTCDEPCEEFLNSTLMFNEMAMWKIRDKIQDKIEEYQEKIGDYDVFDEYFLNLMKGKIKI